MTESGRTARSQRSDAPRGRRHREVVGPFTPRGDIYEGGEAIAGPIDETCERLSFRSVIGPSERWVLVGLLVVSVASSTTLIVGLLLAARTMDAPVTAATTLGLIVLVAIAFADGMRLIQTLGLGVFAIAMHDPVPMRPVAGMRVAVITTIVPSVEPIELVARTLSAMRSLDHDGLLDVWILDEGDSPIVRACADQLGVRYFTRARCPEYNTSAGIFRAGTKAGNHNAWRIEHGGDYDVVAQVDPDHVPRRSFLHRTLGYFRDPDVAFVVAPQVYGNAFESWVARAASAQGYVFAGVVQRGGNAFATPLLIGTNHVYRVEAWEQIGGYQDSLIEDHLTGMVVEGTVNPATGRNWKGVYTPDILAVGEGPATWADFFRQQQRWSAGVWAIVMNRRSRAPIRLARRQRAAYAFLQSFYPTIGVSWLVGLMATLVYLSGIGSPSSSSVILLVPCAWVGSVVSWFALFTWLRKWNLQPHERRETVLRSWAVTLFTAPVYAGAALHTLSRRRTSYHVTGKGALRRTDKASTFAAHLLTAAVLALVLVAGIVFEVATPAAILWSLAGFAVCITPPAMAVVAAMVRRGGVLALRRSRDLPRRTHRWRRSSHQELPPLALPEAAAMQGRSRRSDNRPHP